MHTLFVWSRYLGKGRHKPTHHAGYADHETRTFQWTDLLSPLLE